MHGIHRTFLLYILPQISQIYTEPSCCMFFHGMHRFTQNLLAVCSPTEFTEHTEPSCCMFSHGIHGTHRTFLLYILPRNSRNTQNLLAVCSPTEFTEYTEPSYCYSPTEFTEYTEPSCCIFSHGIHGIHRTFLLYVLPQIAQIFTDAAFKGVHLSQVHQPVLLLHFLLCWCTSCSVGALETSAPP